MIPLSTLELEAYAAFAGAEHDAPLAAVVAELRARRQADHGKPWAILVVAAQQAALVPPLFAVAGAPVLVLAPLGTRLPRFRVQQSPCLLDTYDPTAPLGLRQLLERHGIWAGP